MTEIKYTILVAEDIDSNYMLIEGILKRSYTMIRACNGIEAVELCAKHNPSLILMDIKMPEMDGLEATTKIREFNKNIPIIALTAFAFSSDLQDAKKAGCNDFMSKPISIPLLKEKIKEYLGEI
ncbi:MAG: response regulator [Rikenellaceae bacterium]